MSSSGPRKGAGLAPGPPTITPAIRCTPDGWQWLNEQAAEKGHPSVGSWASARGKRPKKQATNSAKKAARPKKQATNSAKKAARPKKQATNSAKKAALGQHAEFEDLEAWDKAATLEPTTDE